MDISIKKFHQRIKEFPFIKKEPLVKNLFKKYPLDLFIGEPDKFTKDVKIAKCYSYRECIRTQTDIYGNKIKYPLYSPSCYQEFYWIPVECFYSPFRVRRILKKFTCINLDAACKYPQFFFSPIFFALVKTKSPNNKIKYSSTMHMWCPHVFADDIQRLFSYIDGISDFKPDFSDSVINLKPSKIKFEDIKESLFK